MSARMLAAFSLIIGFNIVFVSLSLLIGYQTSKSEWNDKVTVEAQITLETIINEIVDQGGFYDAVICRQALSDARERLIGVAQIDFFDSEGQLLISWINHTLEYYTPRPIDPETASPYYLGETLVGYLSMHPTDFRNLEYNRRFVFILILTSLGGMIASTTLSLFLAFRITRYFTKEAKDTARGLMNLAKGSRNIEMVPAATSEIATINEAAAALQKILIKEESQKSRWYENIAHDLRTPITAMKSQFIACRDGILPLTPERWEAILGELAGMESMIKDFTFLSKIESSNLKVNKQNIKSRAIMEYLTNSLSPVAKEKEISLTWDYQHFSFYCDFSLITTAFSQLVRNAIQHSPPASEIHVTFKIESGIGVFQVINTGQLTQEAIERIFDPLYKTDTSRTKNGSGMGLTISHQIAHILGAKLSVQNLSGEKILFKMILSSCSATNPAADLH